MPGNTYCAVVGCVNNVKKQRNLGFFRMPKERSRIKIWAERIGRPDILRKNNPKSYRVCAVHFLPSMFVNKRLNKAAVPTLHIPDKDKLIRTNNDPSYILDEALKAIKEEISTINTAYPETQESLPVNNIESVTASFRGPSHSQPSSRARILFEEDLKREPPSPTLITNTHIRQHSEPDSALGLFEDVESNDDASLQISLVEDLDIISDINSSGIEKWRDTQIKQECEEKESESSLPKGSELINQVDSIKKESLSVQLVKDKGISGINSSESEVPRDTEIKNYFEIDEREILSHNIAEIINSADGIQNATQNEIELLTDTELKKEFEDEGEISMIKDAELINSAVDPLLQVEVSKREHTIDTMLELPLVMTTTEKENSNETIAVKTYSRKKHPMNQTPEQINYPEVAANLTASLILELTNIDSNDFDRRNESNYSLFLDTEVMPKQNDNTSNVMISSTLLNISNESTQPPLMDIDVPLESPEGAVQSDLIPNNSVILNRFLGPPSRTSNIVKRNQRKRRLQRKSKDSIKKKKNDKIKKNNKFYRNKWKRPIKNLAIELNEISESVPHFTDIDNTESTIDRNNREQIETYINSKDDKETLVSGENQDKELRHEISESIKNTPQPKEEKDNIESIKDQKKREKEKTDVNSEDYKQTLISGGDKNEELENQSDNSIFLDTTDQYSTKDRKNRDQIETDVDSEDDKQILVAEGNRDKELDNESDIFINQDFHNDYLQCQKRICSQYKGSKYNIELKLFALNLYFKSPHTYEYLEKNCDLPSLSMIKEIEMNFKTGVSNDLIALLSINIRNSPEYKYCIITLKEVKLKSNVYYDVHSDEIIGFVDTGGSKQREIATHAIVMILSGCFENYKQALGYVFGGSIENVLELSNWLLTTIRKLTDAGFVVCAVTMKQSKNFIKLARQMGVSSETPYFFIDDKKVCNIFDMPHLMETLRNMFFYYDFSNNDGMSVVCWKHLEVFYNKDLKRFIRIAPNLSDYHLEPPQGTRTRYATEVFSYPVAAGISLDVEPDLLDDARHTAQFILNLSYLIDITNSSKESNDSQYKMAFGRLEHQLECFNYFLETFKYVDIQRREDVSSATEDEVMKYYDRELFTSLKITLRAFIELSECFASDGINSFFTKPFQQGPTVAEVLPANLLTDEPVQTPIQFMEILSKIIMNCLFKNACNEKREIDFKEFLEYQTHVSEEPLLKTELSRSKLPHAEPLNFNNYKLDFPLKSSYGDVCKYLLQKCAVQHVCMKFHKHKEYKDGEMEPSEKFKDYIKLIEDRFTEIFEQIILCDSVGRKAIELIKMDDFETKKPCPCFPVNFLVLVYLRVAIHLKGNDIVSTIKK